MIESYLIEAHQMEVETSTPPNTMIPIGPYSHIAIVGDFITIGGIAGVDPATGELAATDIASQTTQILNSFELMLESVDSDLAHIVHINIFMVNMDDYKAMNAAYTGKLSQLCPARTVVAVTAAPKPGALITMNLTAVKR